VKGAHQEEEEYVLLNPDDAVEIAEESAAPGQAKLAKNEPRSLQQALLAEEEIARKAPKRPNPNERRVRAPRFSDAEWARLERQVDRVFSSTLNALGRRRLMTAHEFVRESAMRAVRILEEIPRGDRAVELHEVLVRGVPGQAATAVAGARTSRRRASARDVPVWEGSKLTYQALDLQLDWKPMEKPSGEPPPELLHAQLKEKRSRDMALCPVEKAVLRLRDDRRRPPGYDAECCICEWPHALPVEWPFDDAGAKLDERDRQKLEAQRRHVQRMGREATPVEAAGKALSPLRSIWDRKRRGPEPTEVELRAELKRLGWELLGRQRWDDGWEGWVASNAAGRKVRGNTPEDVAQCAARANRDEAGGRELQREFHALDEAFKDVDGEALCREYYGPDKPPRPGEVYRYFCELQGTTRPCEACGEEKLPRAWVSPERKIYSNKRTKAEKGSTSFGVTVCRKCCSLRGIRQAIVRSSRKHLEERAAQRPKAPSGSSDEFYTPSRIFLPLHKEFGFTLDVCATAESAKCERYFTKEQDGLARSWEGEVWWCNPPYSPGNLAAFVAKCAEEARKPGHRLGVSLLPSRTGVGWWQKHIEPGLKDGSLEVRFHKGRIAFGYPGNPEGLGGGTGRFDSAFIIWRRKP
jgi:phage N-6-adenine-methyltransferase